MCRDPYLDDLLRMVLSCLRARKGFDQLYHSWIERRGSLRNGNGLSHVPNKNCTHQLDASVRISTPWLVTFKLHW
jgi:hypothetical protein